MAHTWADAARRLDETAMVADDGRVLVEGH
jgi:hypothetical protein